MPRIDEVQVTSLRNAASSFLGVVEDRQQQGGVAHVGIQTGFAKVDYWTGGLQPDCMWVVGARTSVGKTSWALDVALNVARTGKAVLFYSMEMRAEALAKRLLSRATGLSAARIERGLVSSSEMRELQQTLESFEGLRLGIIDRTLSSEMLCNHALGFREKHDVDLLIVDHAQALSDPAHMGETEKVGMISNRLRGLVRPDRMNCPLVLLAQLNRGSENRENHTPTLADLRNSGNLEQDAEVVLLLYRPYLYERMRGADPLDCEEAQIIVAKCRDGMTGSTVAQFYPSQTRWQQLAPEPVRPHPTGAYE